MAIHEQVLPGYVLGEGSAKSTEAGSLGEASIGSRMDGDVAASASVYVLGIGLASFSVRFSFNHLTPQALHFDTTKTYTMALSLSEASTTVYICASVFAILSICAFLRRLLRDWQVSPNAQREAADMIACAIDSHRVEVHHSVVRICDVLRQEGEQTRRVLREEKEKTRWVLRKEGEKTRWVLREEWDMTLWEARIARAAISSPTRATSEIPHGSGNSMSPGTGAAREGEPSTARTAEGEERRPSELASTDSSGWTTAQKKRGKAAKRPQFPNDRSLVGKKSS